ncbi:hypothetical protein EJ04DRAFT_337047 [Polyplosphaeria fusca]|uniref:Zn(2)-C6 fungal-type domain-containing protein n=1 Tax=Polyplosphaeria fusca TaxID=682080 RepID=A0A9P4QWL7_9PLEO|nr:hypothetical protein EJ04DRAFT_337047 [Polyplosphaeria fusca]
MPSAVQTQVINSHNHSYMLKERAGEPAVSGFTAVNGRTSPPSPPRSNGNSDAPTEPLHVRPVSQSNVDHSQEHRLPFPGRDEWAPAPRVTTNALPNGYQSVSPPLTEGSVSPPLNEASPGSPSKRKRSSSAEDDHSDLSPDGFAAHRRRLDPYASGRRDDSPSTAARGHPTPMDTQQRILPPIDRPGHERNWAPRESQEAGHNGYSESHYRDHRAMDSARESNNRASTSPTHMNGATDSQDGLEHSSTTELTRAGVQVDPKKRKRQFANRTKTGCGTCRRRKKKCDEAKPECNNCARGGFICEGYLNKIPWPKNGAQKPHPPLQAKDQYLQQLYHSHGTPTREGYQEPNAQPATTEGVRTQPIVVEDHERARGGWGQSWAEPPRAAYPPERHQQPAEYPQSTGAPPQARPPSNDHHAPQPAQGPPSQRPHNPRIYHHTQQTMSHVVNNSTAEGGMPQQAQHPHHPPQAHQPPPTGAPGPPPPHYAPQPPQQLPRTEKEKMLSGEPFRPYLTSLHEERQRCKFLLYQFNNTTNPANQLTAQSIERHLAAIFSPHGGPARLGREVCLEIPFSCDYGTNITIGDRVAIGSNCKFMDSGKISIGKNTTIESNVTINTIEPPKDHKTIKGTHGFYTARNVIIGESVFIGANSIICAGVQIGDGAIIEHGSVVRRDVPRNVVVRGPAAEVRGVYFEET